MELIDGTLVRRSVGLFESRIATNLMIQLGGYVNQHDLGGVSGEAIPFECRPPDGYVCRMSRSSSRPETRKMAGRPTLHGH